ncbi:2-oxoglutarate dehydrogenase [Cryptosporidium andersoni]|uniref:2-oxoglutarate dehydrogenase n=1 Tax=Cryptosporidium andersoni TaxID=117008 RepID=A0A1J4MB89_9CRYT|nr:2-oxoglutarate dehydrogenase [Cryptosporidium andersoni]
MKTKYLNINNISRCIHLNISSLKKSSQLQCSRYKSHISNIDSHSNFGLDSLNYLESLYYKWRAGEKINYSLSSYFSKIELAQAASSKFISIVPLKSNNIKIANILNLVSSFETYGHQFAELDPLNLESYTCAAVKRNQEMYRKLLKPETHGILGCDIISSSENIIMNSTSSTILTDILLRYDSLKVDDLVRILEKIFCGKTGFEYIHVRNEEIKSFMRSAATEYLYWKPSKDDINRYLQILARAQLFENMCSKKFPTVKRFGLDGCESLILGLSEMLRKFILDGNSKDSKITIGMSHRGRLNVMCNILNLPLENMFYSFRSGKFIDIDTKSGIYGGDVKYHMGYSGYYELNERFISDAPEANCPISFGAIPVEILYNPSHLESVVPVVMGKVKSEQYYSERKGVLDTAKKYIPILIHGDASTMGQGVVSEALNMSKISSYNIGGNIHIIINNQIGFCTYPSEEIGSMYPSDISRGFDIPIIHVNADCPESVVYVFLKSLEFRNRFHSDVFINLVGYRRFGHNELDMPLFTHPLMYKKITSKPGIFHLYKKKLAKEKVFSNTELDHIEASISSFIENKYNNSTSDTFKRNLEGFKSPTLSIDDLISRSTLDNEQEILYPPQWRVEELKSLGTKLSTIPSSIDLHPNIIKIYEQRSLATEKENKPLVDYGLAETLSFATLLKEGIHIRLVGEDTKRGTFSHRHSVLYDINNNREYSPLKEFSKLTKYSFTVENSILSEFAGLGFEVGYVQSSGPTLGIWEAQFGDFANGAQIMFDQYISSSIPKWNLQIPILCILPHGYDGMGPEHSSARVERYLQLSNEPEEIPINEGTGKPIDKLENINWQLVYCSNSAQYYHIFRKHMWCKKRIPTLIFLSKRLLKYRHAFSSLKDLSESSFLSLIPDNSSEIDNLQVRKLIICCGQIYYNLVQQRSLFPNINVPIIRLEQLIPFPWAELFSQISSFPMLSEIVFAQEEPQNMGAWSFVQPRLRSIVSLIARTVTNYEKRVPEIKYAGRKTNSATATGFASLHEEELHNLLSNIIS